MAFADSVIKGLQDDFLTGEYSDMRLIDSQGTVHHVHKVVLCHQSPFFKNAMKKGRFKEGYENTIHLKDKKTLLVNAMLHYLYYQSFTCPVSYTATTRDRILFDIYLWALADEYMITSLREYVFNKLKDVMTPGPDMPEDGRWMWDFLLLAHDVYEKVPDTEKELRLLFTRHAAHHILKLLPEEGFRQLMKDLPDFAFDLTELLAKNCMKLILGEEEDFLLSDEISLLESDED